MNRSDVGLICFVVRESHNGFGTWPSQKITNPTIHYFNLRWNYQTFVGMADFVSDLQSVQSFHFLALSETWITPDNLAKTSKYRLCFCFIKITRLLLSYKRHFTSLSCSHLNNLFFNFVYRPPEVLETFIQILHPSRFIPR